MPCLAVGLGSSDALLRSYLGKAYFEEKRAPLDFEQFDMAKQLDPNDPTALAYRGYVLAAQPGKTAEAAALFEKALTLDLAAFEDSELYDRMTRARREASLRPQRRSPFLSKL